MIPDKLPQLQKLLERTPNDPFLIYAIGMEYKKRSDWPNAVAQFSRAIDVDLNYCYAYYQRGQAQESAGDVAAARDSYLAGIEAAKRTNDEHAKGELEMALSMIE